MASKLKPPASGVKRSVRQDVDFFVVTDRVVDPYGKATILSIDYFDGQYEAALQGSIERQRNSALRHRLKAVAKEKLLLSQDGKCIYCHEPFSAERPPTLEHLTPRSRGGAEDIANYALSCSDCNLAKGSMTHEEYLAKIG